MFPDLFLLLLWKIYVFWKLLEHLLFCLPRSPNILTKQGYSFPFLHEIFDPFDFFILFAFAAVIPAL